MQEIILKGLAQPSGQCRCLDSTAITDGLQTTAHDCSADRQPQQQQTLAAAPAWQTTSHLQLECSSSGACSTNTIRRTDQAYDTDPHANTQQASCGSKETNTTANGKHPACLHAAQCLRPLLLVVIDRQTAWAAQYGQSHRGEAVPQCNAHAAATHVLMLIQAP